MNNLSERQKRVLYTIVDEYIQTAKPIGSTYLVKEYNWDLSSATIRNEMAYLEKLDFICQPFVSAGRVPVLKGYRWYVDSWADFDHWEQKEIVHNNILREWKNILSKIGQMQKALLLQQLVDNFAYLFSAVVIFISEKGDFYSGGLPHLLKMPEFLNRKLVLELVAILERKEEMFRFLTTIPFQNGDINVYIGRENLLNYINNFSSVVMMINSNYLKGWLYVLGLMRMPYRKVSVLLNRFKKELEKIN